MKRQPPYFERIRQRAAQRWDQLELDPELAGPWHQLFKQVQSPRHILSELLQNADDAGAKEASVRIEHRIFIFEHNGEDFGEENFASLCRFGYSNKRALHTVGFRGVGFKSTFSLGDEVELFTPSLSICFHRMRSTEPKWLSTQAGTEATELSPLRPEFEISPDTPASDTAGGQIVTEDADTLASRPRPAPKVVKQSLVERFAKTQGFRKDGEERFYHENGSWIARARDSRFSWERRAANGDLLRYYWPKEHCLEREPLQLEADIWGMIEQHPETHALILSNVEGNPLEITGARLRAMRDEGEVILYPASYRLVYDHDHKT